MTKPEDLRLYVLVQSRQYACPLFCKTVEAQIRIPTNQQIRESGLLHLCGYVMP